MQTELNYPDDANTEMELKGVWSMGDHLLVSDVVAINGTATIEYSDHWGEGGEVSIEVTNPTFNDLYFAASELIKRSGDDHHVFIEDFIFKSEGVWRLATGS